MSKVITIHRQYGAGGRSLARALSEKFGIPWYDKDFVRETVRVSGYSEEEVESDSEELSGSDKLLDSILGSAATYTSPHLEIWKAQKEVILKLAESSCIIVGRASNIILQEAGVDSLDVFLYADIEKRIPRAHELTGHKEKDIRAYIEKVDKKRANYFKTYTKKAIDDYHNYDLMLNTGLLSKAECVDIIEKHFG